MYPNGGVGVVLDGTGSPAVACLGDVHFVQMYQLWVLKVYQRADTRTVLMDGKGLCSPFFVCS